MKTLITALILSSLSLSAAHAGGFKGSISFTEEEKAFHLASQDQLLEAAAACLERDIAHHKQFYRRHGFSPFYGDRSAFGKLSSEGKRSFLRRSGFSSALASQMEATSCVGLALKCLGQGFKAAGQESLWQRIRQFTMQNDVDGTAMQAALQQLGWVVLYWNPDVRMNRSWDRAEKGKDPSNKDRFWGYHEYNWGIAQKGRYLYNRVDDFRALVNFGEETPALLKEVPFFLGTAHGGYHVFPGSRGKVIESHSTRAITDPRSLEADAFSPLKGLAPTEGMYKSGLIAVPAKYLR